MNTDIVVEDICGRPVAIKGIGKMFYQEGFPLSISISELKKRGVEVSMFHVVEELWENGWEWKTIESKLKGEIEYDIDGLKLDIPQLMEFYSCLEQPYRGNGGYEKSREMIFDYLFGSREKAIEWAKTINIR